MLDEAVHLNPDSVEEYFRLGVVSVFQLSQQVDARLEIDPVSDQLRLFVPANGNLPKVANLERVRVDLVEGHGELSRFRIIFDAHDMHYAAYQLIESIVGYMREGSVFGHAVLASISDMKDLLASRGRLSDLEETGLWGELLVLEHVVDRVGAQAAVESWLGPAASEHDFSFPEFEAEVKTTRGEFRRHHVRGDLQLEGSPHRPLFFISIQVTLAGPASNGRTLPKIVADVRGRFLAHVTQFEAALSSVGYRDEDADLYETSFQLRSKPRAYLVDLNFPAMTRSRISGAVPNSHLISDVSYRVDVGGLLTASIPAPLEDFCEERL